MKSNGIVRIETLRLKNFKNIKNCEISYSEAKKIERGIVDEDDFSSILGLYGQNGSGKTSCVEGFRVLQALLTGAPLNPTFGNLINIDSDMASVGADFYIKIGSIDVLVNYDCTIKKSGNLLMIDSEKMSYHLINESNKKINAFSFKAPFEINNTFKEYIGTKNFDIYKMISNLESIGNASNPNFTSTIFNNKLIQLVSNSKSESDIYLSIINELNYFAKYRFAIYQINYFNELNDVGIRIRIKDEKEFEATSCNDIFISFNQTTIKVEHFNLLKQTIDNINKILPSIIKGCTIEMLDVIKTKTQSLTISNDIVNFRLVSKKDNKYIPLYYESNGIKKIISILSGLIDAFNHEGTFVVIDELDSGIFEYLLGELIYAFDNFAFGQVFFTSHNLRILEKTNSKNIYFSTINSDDKFIQFVQVRDSNNLRNLYYKYIANGYKEKYRMYNDIKTEDIISAFTME